MNFAKFPLKHPAVIGMILIVLAFFGIMSITSTSMEFISNISMPSIYVVSIYPGASAEDVENDITKILEDDFVTLPNFKGIKSTSSNSVSIITIDFRDGTDLSEQLAEVRHRITQLVASLPDGMSGTPNALLPGASMLPCFSFSIKAGKDLGRLTEYFNETLRPQITSVKGVSGVEISGGKELQVNVKLHLAELAAKGISVTQVFQILNYGNVNLPIGDAEYQSKTIDIDYNGGFTSLEDIKNLPVGSGDQNVVIRLKDVADVYIDYEEQNKDTFQGDENIIVVSVLKRTDGDVMSISKDMKKILADATAQSGGAVQFEIVNDDARTVGASLSNVIISGVTGVVAAIFILFLFLSDLRATLIIAISIPLSILFTFIGMKVLGITINLMSLSGMVVSLGMIVDGSIVMIEQVFRYYTARNDDGTQKYALEDSILTASGEVSSSVFASTATSVVVFLPIAFLEGLIGSILKDVALTIAFCLIASVLVALIVVPFLMKFILKKTGPKPKKKSFFNRGIDKLEKAYKKGLTWALKNGKFVLSIAVGVLIISFIFIGALGITFLPSTDNSDFYVYMEFPIGQSLEETTHRMEQAQAIINKAVPEIKTSVYYSGDSGGVMSYASSSPNLAYAHIVLVPVAERKRDVHKIILEVQDLLIENIPDAKVKVSNGGFDKLLGYVTGGGGYGITLVGENIDLLLSESARIKDFLLDDPDVVSVAMDMSYDSTSLSINMNQEYLSSLGITSYEAGVTSAILFRGMDAGRFTGNDGARYDVHLFSDITDKPITNDEISNIKINSATGKQVSFGSLSNTKIQKSISQINHIDRAKTCTISANLVGEDTKGVSDRVSAYLSKEPLKDGLKTRTGGIMELIETSFPTMFRAILIAIFLVYTVMVLQFERFKQPLLILSTVPFCVIGVVLGLLTFHSTMNLLSLMGVISLAGVVVNNAIILIDYTNLLRSEAKESGKTETTESLKEIIIVSASSRIRPILMTTLTTMIGVIPMAFASGEGAEIYAPLGQAIAGGLLTSTIITLFIIPVLYYLTEKPRKKKANAPLKVEDKIDDKSDDDKVELDKDAKV